MKKTFRFLLMAITVATLSLSCTKDPQPSKPDDPAEGTQPEKPEEPAKQILEKPVIELIELGQDHLSFEWNRVEDATSYEYVLVQGNQQILSESSTEVIVVECGNLQPGTDYVIKVRALADPEVFIPSEWSEKNVTTTMDPGKQPVNIPDAALMRRLLEMTPAVDSDGDGVISAAEAAAVEEISFFFEYEDEVVEDLVIKDITGLEAFTALKRVNLKFNQISDASPLFKLSDLTFINLGENPVSELDLTALPNMEDIRIFGTSISKLEIEKTPNLICLYAQRCPITSLDLSPLKNLEECYLNESRIASIKAEGLPKLTRLDAVKSKLTEVIIRDCPELFQLHLNTNQLSGVTLEKLPKLMILNLYENQLTEFKPVDVPMIMNLFLFKNKLTTLDLSGFASLTRLMVTSNPLTELNLSANPMIEELEAYDMSELILINLKNDAFSDYAYYDFGYDAPNPKLTKVIVDAGAEEEYVKGLFKSNPAVQVVTE